MKRNGLVLCLLLLPQFLGWIWLAKQVPDIPTDTYYDRYRFNAQKSCFERFPDYPGSISRLVRLEMDSNEGRLTRIVEYRDASFILMSKGPSREILLLGDTTFGLRSLRDGKPISERPDLVRCPGKEHVVVNNRFLVGCDESNFYVCDVDFADRQPIAARNPFSQTLAMKVIEGQDRFYGVPGSEFDPLEAPSFEQVAGSVMVQKVALFSVDGEGVQLLNSWSAMDNGTSSITFSDPILTQVDGSLVSLSADGSRLEYRSIEDGRLLESVPTPVGFRPRSANWRLQETQLHFGNSGSYRVFDLIRRRFFNIPGEGQYLARRIPEAGISWFFAPVTHRTNRRIRQGTWNIFDEQENRMLFSFSTARGEPIWINDPQRIAIGSSRYGFSIEKVDLDTGSGKLELAPLRWLFGGLILLTACYLLWSIAYWRYINNSIIPNGIIVPGILLPLAVVFDYRLFVLGYPTSEFGGGFDVFEQWLRAICYATAFTALMLVWLLPLRVAAKVWGTLFCMAATATMERTLAFRVPLDHEGSEWMGSWPSLDELTSRFCILFLFVFLATRLAKRLGLQLQVTEPLPMQPRKTKVASLLARLAFGTPQETKASLSILDWIVATAALAWLFSALSGRLDWESVVDFFLYLPACLSLSILVSAMACLFAVWGALATSRKLFLCCSSLFLILGLVSVLQPVLDFAWTNPPLVETMNVAEMRYSLATPALVYLYFLALRHAHWRLTRVSNTSNRLDSVEGFAPALDS